MIRITIREFHDYGGLTSTTSWVWSSAVQLNGLFLTQHNETCHSLNSFHHWIQYKVSCQSCPVILASLTSPIYSTNSTELKKLPVWRRNSTSTEGWRGCRTQRLFPNPELVGVRKDIWSSKKLVSTFSWIDNLW